MRSERAPVDDRQEKGRHEDARHDGARRDGVRRDGVLVAAVIAKGARDRDHSIAPIVERSIFPFFECVDTRGVWRVRACHDHSCATFRTFVV